MKTNTRRWPAAAAALSLMLLAGCGHDNGVFFVPVLSVLPNLSTVGSTTDPVGRGLNPYGLDIARTTAGLLQQGDLIACNFNDGATNTQGQGTTLVALHPDVGAAPLLIADSPLLLGCSAVAALPDGNIVVAASQANALQLVSPDGVISTPYAGDGFANPWGVTFADSPAGPALYVSNSTLGTIDRISLSATDAQTGFTEIASGFAVSGVPGAIAAPSGLTYDDLLDTLYVVDTATNSVVALSNVSNIGSDGVQVTVSGGSDHFSGAAAGSARIVAAGAPLNLPISAALLPSGNLIVGNTGDAGGTNLMLEISPTEGVLATRNVDAGAAGALFGIAIGPDAYGNPIIFFNDDNDNTVKALSD